MTSGKKNMQCSLENLAFYPTSEVYKWATTLVIACHPDNEIMGCGGAITLLRQMGYRVHVLFICDGALSCPSHPYLSTQCLSDLRKCEAESALSLLGVSCESITFLDRKDPIPLKLEQGFESIVNQFRIKISDLIPDTVLLPWHYDNQKDHLAVWQIMQEVLKQETYTYNLIEYSLQPWLTNEQLQQLGMAEHLPWKLDNKHVLEHKIEALSKYHLYEIDNWQETTQTAEFLSSEMLSYFTHPWEIYIQTQY